MAKKNQKAESRHHACWQNQFYMKPQARRLRGMFIELIDSDLHHYIHANLSNIPTPPEDICRKAIKQFDGTATGLLPKIVWLAENVDYAPFKEAMWRQYEIVISYKKPH